MLRFRKILDKAHTWDMGQKQMIGEDTDLEVGIPGCWQVLDYVVLWVRSNHQHPGKPGRA